MPINEEGRQKLISALRESVNENPTSTSSPAYDQNEFGDLSCGRACCMAGYALYLQIGPEAWEEKVFSIRTNIKAEEDEFDAISTAALNKIDNFQDECVLAGEKLLGLKPLDRTPDIFSDVSKAYWPPDLYEKYRHAKNQEERVEAAISALMRIDEYGNLVNKYE